MFERFTDSARQSLFFARVHAAERRGDAIDLEDVLMGVLTAAPEAVSRVASDLAALELSNRATSGRRQGEGTEEWARRIIEAEWSADPRREIPVAGPAKAALQDAVTEANDLQHTPIRPGHLLLGILRQEGTTAWQTLMEAGVTLRALRAAMAEEQ